MIDDIELSDQECPQCGQCPTHTRDCDRCGGEGYRDDLFEEDPHWYMPEDTEICFHCDGKGIHHWCPKCGADIKTESEYEDPEES